MNKLEFLRYIAIKHNIDQKEAIRVIDLFTTSLTSALAEDKEITLIGFGNFSVRSIPARKGRNPRTGEEIQLKAYNQPKFKVGKKLKDAVN
jgi:DNA-binding protein HU-beta